MSKLKNKKEGNNEDRMVTIAAWQISSISTCHTVFLLNLFTFMLNDSHYVLWELILNAARQMPYGRLMLPMHPNSGDKYTFLLAIGICSHFIRATAQTGESSRKLKPYTWTLHSSLGACHKIKTDNAPTFTSIWFKPLCSTWKVDCHTGTPFYH